MKNVAILLTSEPQNGGEHQYLVLLAESMKKCDGKYFHLIAICCNRFWKKWCKEQRVEFVQVNMSDATVGQMRMQALFPHLCLFHNMMCDPIGQIIRKKKISLLICGQQGVFLPKYSCKVMRPVHD